MTDEPIAVEFGTDQMAEVLELFWALNPEQQEVYLELLRKSDDVPDEDFPALLATYTERLRSLA